MTQGKGASGGAAGLFGVLLAVGAILSAPEPASAQAWVPAKGDLDISLAYQYMTGGDHLFSRSVEGMDMGAYVGRGKTAYVGDDIVHAVLIGVDFGITDTLALGASVAYVAAEYEGSMPIGSIDDGKFRPTFQDVGIELRYMLLDEPFLLTPLVGIVVPTHDYPILGHSAVGRDLVEVRVGTNLGRRLDPILPDGYVAGRYAYSFMEDPGGIDIDMSNAELQAGYFPATWLDVHMLVHYQVTHGGLDWVDDLDTEEARRRRNQAAAESYVRLGVGAAFSITDAATIGANWSMRAWGENTTEGKTVQVTMSYGFYPLFEVPW